MTLPNMIYPEPPAAGSKISPIRRQPEEVKARISAAAKNAFTSYGFEGATVRTIARDAHVSLSLLLYHFKNKDKLWREVIEKMNAQHPSWFNYPGFEGAAAKSAADQLTLFIDHLVRSFAENPDIHRLMVMEAHRPSERLVWLCDQYLKTDFDAIIALIVRAQREGAVRNFSAARLRYAIVSLAAVPFSVSAEYQYLTGSNPFNSREIKSTIDFIHRVVFVDGR